MGYSDDLSSATAALRKHPSYDLGREEQRAKMLSDSRASRREAIATAVLAVLAGRHSYGDAARSAVKYADSLIAELDKT